MCSASLTASVYALGTSAWGRHDPFAESPVNGRYLRKPDALLASAMQDPTRIRAVPSEAGRSPASHAVRCSQPSAGDPAAGRPVFTPAAGLPSSPPGQGPH